MSFDHSVFQAEFVKHLQNRLGWPKDISDDAAAIASDVIAQTHGGERHYIQSRLIDRNGVRAFYKDGSEGRCNFQAFRHQHKNGLPCFERVTNIALVSTSYFSIMGE